MTANEFYTEIAKALFKHIPNDKIIEFIQQVKDEWLLEEIVKAKSLSEPDPDDYITGYDYEHNGYISDDLRYISDMEDYEASKVIADVENVKL